MRPPLSKLDYGWIRHGGMDWYGASGGYFGPPHSFWYSILPWVIAIMISSIAMAFAGG